MEMTIKKSLYDLVLTPLVPSGHWRCYCNHVPISSQTWANKVGGHTLWYVIYSTVYTDVHGQAIIAKYLQHGEWK